MFSFKALNHRFYLNNFQFKTYALKANYYLKLIPMNFYLIINFQ